MTEFLTASLGFILLMLALGLVRVLRGPGEPDRMMAAQLIGTGGIAALLLLGAVSGEPAAMGFCHCESCRSWAAAPVNAFTLWKPEQVRVTQGEAEIGHYSKAPTSDRKWCRKCGGHVFTAHPHWNLVDVYAATIPDFPYRAAVHVNYQETRLRMRDGLPKMKDLPKEMGGSGETAGE